MNLLVMKVKVNSASWDNVDKENNPPKQCQTKQKGETKRRPKQQICKKNKKRAKIDKKKRIGKVTDVQVPRQVLQTPVTVLVDSKKVAQGNNNTVLTLKNDTEFQNAVCDYTVLLKKNL